MTTIKAEIVAHSNNDHGDELISVLATFPRIILAEVNTHRMLSKNTSSSRAIPFKKMVETVMKDPFIPIAWQKEHKGMQGSEYHTLIENVEEIEQEWLYARDVAISQAKILNESDITKQLCNRLLEPFMWTTMLITGSREGWDNFFNLRCPSYDVPVLELATKDGSAFFSKKRAIEMFPECAGFDELTWLKCNKGQAEIHIMDLAEKIWDAVNDSTPKQLEAGEWHIPFEDKIQWSVQDGEYTTYLPETLVKISTAMAARTSYTVVGDDHFVDVNKMISLHDKLLEQDPPHSSPMEHCCTCVTEEEYNNSFKGQEKGWFRNYKGFKSYRQIIEESL